jgi:peptidyl-prolyl cis-trans isomerase B (cyclophilin B)
MALLPEVAPNHVGYFMKTARDGAFAKTTIHRVIKYGIIQGGDPFSRDPAKAAAYGTGGLNVGLKPEFSKEPMTAGAVAAVLIPNQPASAGAQFFVCVTDQVALTGQYTVFGRVVEGIEIVQQISAVDADGVFDNTPFHRVVPGFVIQTGSIAHRAPLSPAQQKLVRNLTPEFTDTPNLPGIVSMARGDDPASATTSFFICVGECRALDSKYTVFARVTSGMDVVQAIAAVPVDGETPKETITVTKVTVQRQ